MCLGFTTGHPFNLTQFNLACIFIFLNIRKISGDAETMFHCPVIINWFGQPLKIFNRLNVITLS